MPPEICHRRSLFFFSMHFFYQRTSNLTDGGAIRAPSQVYQYGWVQGLARKIDSNSSPIHHVTFTEDKNAKFALDFNQVKFESPFFRSGAIENLKYKPKSAGDCLTFSSNLVQLGSLSLPVNKGLQKQRKTVRKTLLND